MCAETTNAYLQHNLLTMESISSIVIKFYKREMSKRPCNKNNEPMPMNQNAFTLRAERAKVMRNFWCMNSKGKTEG